MSSREPQSPKQRYEREIEEILSRDSPPDAEQEPRELEEIERARRKRGARPKPSRPARPRRAGFPITGGKVFAGAAVLLIAAIVVRPLFVPLGLAALALFAWGYYLSLGKRGRPGGAARPVKRWRGEIVDDGGRRASTKPSRLRKWLGKR